MLADVVRYMPRRGGEYAEAAGASPSTAPARCARYIPGRTGLQPERRATVPARLPAASRECGAAEVV
jgi:hypothetical protein